MCGLGVCVCVYLMGGEASKVVGCINTRYPQEEVTWVGEGVTHHLSTA